MTQEAFIYIANTFVGITFFLIALTAVLAALGHASAQHYIHDEEENYDR